MEICNWGGNVHFKPGRVERPRTIEELAAVIKVAGEQKRKVRAIGSGHSFSPLIKTSDVLIDLGAMTGLIRVDSSTATFWAGTPVATATELLWHEGLALANQGDINHQTLAGAVSTGTHGTGLAFGSLSSFVRELEFVDGEGRVQVTTPETLHAAQVSLGAFGIITRVSLQCRPRFLLRDHRHSVTLESALSEFSSWAKQHRHLEFFWFPWSKHVQLKALDEVTEENPRSKLSQIVGDEILERWLFKGVCEVTKMLPALSPTVSRMCGKLMPDSDHADWSWRVYPSSREVRFTEMEYSVPLTAGPECFRAIANMIMKKNIHVFFPLEYRVAASDAAWLSPFHNRTSAIISLHVYKRVDEERYFREAEAIFRDFEGRPHWGKIHTPAPEMAAQSFKRWDDFSQLRRKFDPEGMFLNDLLGAWFKHGV
jgi:FAD-linked oxidoreductase